MASTCPRNASHPRQQLGLFSNRVRHGISSIRWNFWEPQDLHLTILSQTGRSISGPCFDLILRSAFFAARLMSAAERLSIRFACLNSLGLIGRGFRETPFPSRFARMQNAAIRPNGLSLMYVVRAFRTVGLAV